MGGSCRRPDPWVHIERCKPLDFAQERDRRMSPHEPPSWLEALVNASDRAAFDAAMRDAQPPKRGRPSKADAEREASYAEYVERITTGSPPPGGWPLVQCDFSVQVP